MTLSIGGFLDSSGASKKDELEGHLFEFSHELWYDIKEAEEELVYEGRVVYPYQAQGIQDQLELSLLKHRIDFISQQLFERGASIRTLRVLLHLLATVVHQAGVVRTGLLSAKEGLAPFSEACFSARPHTSAVAR